MEGYLDQQRRESGQSPPMTLAESRRSAEEIEEKENPPTQLRAERRVPGLLPGGSMDATAGAKGKSCDTEQREIPPSPDSVGDLERENGQPRRSDAWCRALGDQDAILEQAIEREDTRG